MTLDEIRECVGAPQKFMVLSGTMANHTNPNLFRIETRVWSEW